jgi:TRAP-type C4-dicarboxylate transport system permease small subunit
MLRIAALVADCVGAAMFAAVFVLFCLKIGMRYFLHDELAWTDEVATILFIWIVFWANAFMLGERDHIRFDLVVHLAGPQTRRAMAVVRALLVGGIFAYALPATVGYIMFLWRDRTPVLQIPLDYVYACFGIFVATVPIRASVSLTQAIRTGWQRHV